jgi:hypothetical protein
MTAGLHTTQTPPSQASGVSQESSARLPVALSKYARNQLETVVSGSLLVPLRRECSSVLLYLRAMLTPFASSKRDACLSPKELNVDDREVTIENEAATDTLPGVSQKRTGL